MAGFFASFIMYAVLIQARPFVTDDYGTVEKNVVELELGTYYHENRDANTYLAIKHGFTDRAEVDLSFSYDYPGVSPLGLSFKVNVLDYKKVHYSINFDTEASSREFNMNNIFALDLNSLVINTNVSTFDNFSVIEAGISPVKSVTDHLDIGCEIRYDFNKKFLAGLGMVIHPSDNISLDAGASYIKNAVQSEKVLTIGIVVDL